MTNFSFKNSHLTKIKSLFSAAILFFITAIATAQPTNNYTKDVMMPSPTAASLGKYGDIPVSYYTGVPNISIPLYTVTDGKLSLPISISYHSSGVKVAETASRVGLGWSLGAGGVVSRTVQGIKDEESPGGYYYAGSTVPTPDDECEWGLHGFEANSGISTDHEPDIFSFNVSGHSGKFYFNEFQEVVLVPQQDVRIEPQFNNSTSSLYHLSGFIIHSPDGTRYYLGDDGNGNLAIETTRYSGDAPEIPTTWYMVKIETQDKKNEITFEYEAENFSFKQPASCNSGSFGCSGGPGIPSSSPCQTGFSKSYTHGLRLTEINTRTEKITFNAGAEREDLDMNSFAQSNTTTKARTLEAVIIENGDFCKRFDFAYGYFEDNTQYASNGLEDKRLRLESLSESACDFSHTKPPHVFEYYQKQGAPDFLPTRLSRAIDHWGFYNGADANNSTGLLNIPETTTTYYNAEHCQSYTATYAGESDRDSHGGPMKYGTLKKITYPTGGETSFDFEANDVYMSYTYTQVNQLIGLERPYCTNSSGSSNTVTLTQQELDESNCTLTFSSWQSCGCTGQPKVRVEAYVPGTTTSGNYVAATEWKQKDCNDPSQTTWPPPSQPSSLDAIFDGDLVAGTPYEFVLVGEYMHASFDAIYSQEIQVIENKEVGGLRIKELANYDGINHDRDVIKTYSYASSGNPNESSGKLFNQPKYSQSWSWEPDCALGTSQCGTCKTYPAGCQGLTTGGGNVVFLDNSIVPLSSFEGYHLGYARVEEIHNGNGSKVFNHFIEGSAAPDPNVFPIPPIQARILSGNVQSSMTMNESGNIVASETNVPKEDDYVASSNKMYKLASLKACCSCPAWTFQQDYTIRTRPYRLASVQSMQDGITVTTDYEYNGNGHLFPTATEFHNSDGKLHRTETFYPNDATWMVGDEYVAIQSMDDADTYMVGVPLRTIKKVDNTEVSGTWTEYKDFDGDGLGLYPHKYHSYKGGWYEEAVVSSYTESFPHVIQMTGWEPETYTWVDGLLTHKQYEGFHWDWQYYTDSRLLQTYTDIDGQSTSYAYDGLMRLSEVSIRDGKVVTEYSYAFGAPDDWQGGNHVRTQISYSDFDDQDTYAYFDGLGRSIDTWRMGYGPNGEDIVSAHMTYDNQGRAEKSVYLPDVQGGLSYTNYVYEQNPLNRQLSESYPDGSMVATEYGNEGQFYTVTTTDENSNPTMSKADIIGRQVLVRDAIGGTTEYEYDDRDNLTKVTNPEDEEYTYSYDARSRMTSKQVPGQDDCHIFLYDDRNLVTASRDPNLKAAGKWIGNEYDVYGRILRTGFGTPNSGTGAACGGTTTVDTDFAISEQLIVNTYDAQGLTGGDCSATYTPIGKLSTTDAAIIKPDGTLDGMLSTKHCYDDYGRTAMSESNSLAGQDVYTLAHDMADHLLTNLREHEGGKLTFLESFDYDHGGRMYAYNGGAWSNLYSDIVSEPGTTLYGAGGGASLAYNTKDQMVGKVVAGMAELSYMYNSRGWLTDINQMPFDQQLLPDTESCRLPENEPPPLPGPGDLEGDCSSCPEGSLTLTQILELRFGGNLNVDCFQDCDCAATCDTTEVVPCPDSIFLEGGDEHIRMEDLKFPTTVYHILKCTGEDDHVAEDRLPYISEQYSVLSRIRLEDEAQSFRVNVDGTDVIMDTEQMLEAIQDDNSDANVETSNEDNDCDPCSSDPPTCSPADSLAQANSLSQIQANLHAPLGLTYPTTLYRIRLCGGDEVYLFDEELDILQGPNDTLQVIEVEDPTDEITVTSDGNTTHYSISFFLCVRDLTTDWIINFYTPCEDNICGNVDEKFDARAVTASTIFSGHDGVPPYRDLVATTSGEVNSIGHDQVSWSIGVYPNIRPPGEAEWDMGISLPPDVEVQSYLVHAIVPEVRHAPIRIGLHDGNGFVKVNGGLDYVQVGNSPFPQQPFVELVPDQLPSLAQIADMKVALHVDIETGVNADLRFVLIDAVYAKMDYTGPCDRCIQEELVCTPETEAAQLDTLESIGRAADTLALDEIPLPASLYRVRLCNGDEVYLLQHEIDLMPQPYQILQVLTVENLTETFNGGLEIVKPQVAPARRKDLFALKLDYYDAKAQGAIFAANGLPIQPAWGYRNGNISRMTWQVAGRDRMVYGFTYDELDRLEYAAYAEQRGPGHNGAGQYYNFGLYSVAGKNGGIAYDGVGNILSLNRNGVTVECDPLTGVLNTTYGQIDALDYTYANSRLSTVKDASGSDAGFRAGQGGALAYGYDANGNMTSDASKDLTATYNHLNLPATATLAITDPGPPPTATAGTVEWTYDATGRKLRKSVAGCPSGDCVSVDYADGIEFHLGTVDINGTTWPKEEVHVNHAEGRASYYMVPDDPTQNYWQGEHNIKDHLGNVRLTFADKNRDGYIQVFDGDPVFGNAPVPPPGYTEVLQENHYYPFGLLMGGDWREPKPMDNVNRYGYNGKELDSDLGLDWHHYGARMYLAEIGRFTGVDPIADEFAHVSAYNYAENTPVNGIDLHGLQLVRTNQLMREGIKQTSPEVSNEDLNRIEQSFNNGFRKGALEGLKLTDANDAFVIGSTLFGSPMHIDGTKASGEDILAAHRGALVPIVSGAAVKKLDDLTNSQKLLPEKGGPVGKISPSEVINKTPSQIDKRAGELGLEKKGPDPKNGKGSYVDPQTGQQRILSHPNSTYKGKPNPHGHVNDIDGNRIDASGRNVAPESSGAHLPIRKEND